MDPVVSLTSWLLLFAFRLTLVDMIQVPFFKYLDFLLLCIGLKIEVRNKTQKYLNIAFAVHFLAITYYVLGVKCIKFSLAKNSSDDTTYTFVYVCPIIIHHFFWFKKDELKKILTELSGQLYPDTSAVAPFKYMCILTLVILTGSALTLSYFEFVALADWDRWYYMIDFYSLKEPFDRSYKMTAWMQLFVVYMRVLYIPWIRNSWMVLLAGLYCYCHWVIHDLDMKSLRRIEMGMVNYITVDATTCAIDSRRKILSVKRRLDNITSFIPAILFLNLLLTISSRMCHIFSKVLAQHNVDIIELTMAIICAFGLVLLVHALNKRSKMYADELAVNVSSIRVEGDAVQSKDNLVRILQNESLFSYTGFHCFNVDLKFLVSFLETLITLSVLFIQILNLEDQR